MLEKVFSSRKSGAGASIAVRVRAHARCFRAPVLAMDFALMPKKPAGVGETEILLAAALFADVGTIVLIHVFPKERT